MQMPRRLSSDRENANPIFQPSVVGRSATLQTDCVIDVKFLPPSTNGDRRNGLSNVLSMSIAVMLDPAYQPLFSLTSPVSTGLRSLARYIVRGLVSSSSSSIE